MQPVFDHVAKFQGDRSRDLGESVAKKVTSRVKHKPSGTDRSGRPNKVFKMPSGFTEYSSETGTPIITHWWLGENSGKKQTNKVTLKSVFKTS